MTDIYFYTIPSAARIENFPILQRIFSPQELKKTNLMPETKHLTSLFGKLIAKTVASKKTGIALKQLQIERTAFGKPYFKNLPDFHFNVSHCENTVAVAFADSPIGIDIEKLKTADFKISERFFNQRENEYIKNSSNPDYAFFEVWTAKEAYFKHKGTGINSDFSKFIVKDDMISKKITTTEYNGFILSVCLNKKSEINIKNFELLNVDNIESL